MPTVNLNNRSYKESAISNKRHIEIKMYYGAGIALVCDDWVIRYVSGEMFLEFNKIEYLSLTQVNSIQMDEYIVLPEFSWSHEKIDRSSIDILRQEIQTQQESNIPINSHSYEVEFISERDNRILYRLCQKQ